jgi:hypothetical protein
VTNVNIKPLKDKAVNFHEPVKTLILTERELLDSDEFIGKLCTWLKLNEMEEVRKGVFK